MKSSPLSFAQDVARLTALRDTGLLDSPDEAVFDDVTRLAQAICNAPIALISLVDAKRQWFKSAIGVDVRETPIETSFCAHAIAAGEVLIVPDTLKDARFRDNNLVTGAPFIRYYAGAPLVGASGHRLGTVCVIDRRPRILNPQQIEALQSLARITSALMSVRAPTGSLLIDGQRGS